MAQVLVRDLDADVVAQLKLRARQHGRSLQKETKAILEDAARQGSLEEARDAAARVRRRWSRPCASRRMSRAIGAAIPDPEPPCSTTTDIAYLGAATGAKATNSA